MEASYENQNKPKLNPWISIWVKPRETMREIFISNPKKVFLLILFGSFVQTLDRASRKSAGDTIDSLSLLFLPVIFGIILGALIYYFLVPTVLRWVGSKLGGQGTFKSIRYAVAYSFIPLIYALVFVWLPSLILFGLENFVTETPRIDSSLTLTVFFYIFVIIDAVIRISTFIIFLKCLGEAHQFSAWKALLTTIVSFIVIIVFPLVLFVFLMAIFIRTI